MKISDEEFLQSIEKVEFWMNKTSINNDLIKAKSHTLKALLCTMKIHSNRDNNPVIKEIAKQLEDIIEDLREGTLELINEGRIEQRESFGKIKEYSNREE